MDKIPLEETLHAKSERDYKELDYNAMFYDELAGEANYNQSQIISHRMDIRELEKIIAKKKEMIAKFLTRRQKAVNEIEKRKGIKKQYNQRIAHLYFVEYIDIERELIISEGQPKGRNNKRLRTNKIISLLKEKVEISDKELEDLKDWYLSNEC